MHDALCALSRRADVELGSPQDQWVAAVLTAKDDAESRAFHEWAERVIFAKICPAPCTHFHQ